MNLSEMITFVREHADTDATDAPDSNLTVYARAAYNDIKRRVPQWISKHTSDTLSTTASTSGYALSGLTTGNLEYVTGVVGPTDILMKIDWPRYLELLDGPDITYTTAEAIYYTVDNGTLYLWPTPSASSTAYTVYGYDTHNAWPSGSTEPDLPREFDELICWYMLGRYYMAQEDVELARLYLQDYEIGVNRQIAAMMRQDQPRVRKLGRFNRGHGQWSYSQWVKRMVEG